MNWDLPTTSVVILGAGFSVAATDGKTPLMGTFFDSLDGRAFPALYNFVVAVAGDPAAANVESVLLILDQVRASPQGVLEGWADAWKTNIATIVHELTLYTLSRLKDSMDISDENWAASLLAECGEETTVISMNYDNIAERVLSNRPRVRHSHLNATCPHCKMRLLLDKACSCGSREEPDESDWRGAVIKPHGSVAWRRCLNEDCCAYECLVADEHCRPFEQCACQHCGKDSAPVLVMPTMSKNLSDTPEIAVMWKAARMAIADAESILLFGFSVPTSDELLVQMIRAAMRANTKIRRVASIDLDPNAVLSRFQRCFPDDVDVEWIPLKVSSGITPAWFSL